MTMTLAPTPVVIASRNTARCPGDRARRGGELRVRAAQGVALLGEKLQRDDLARAPFACAVDAPHAPGAREGENLEARFDLGKVLQSGAGACRISTRQIDSPFPLEERFVKRARAFPVRLGVTLLGARRNAHIPWVMLSSRCVPALLVSSKPFRRLLDRFEPERRVFRRRIDHRICAHRVGECGTSRRQARRRRRPRRETRLAATNRKPRDPAVSCKTDADCPGLACGPCKPGSPVTKKDSMVECAVDPCLGQDGRLQRRSLLCRRPEDTEESTGLGKRGRLRALNRYSAVLSASTSWAFDETFGEACSGPGRSGSDLAAGRCRFQRSAAGRTSIAASNVQISPSTAT